MLREGGRVGAGVAIGAVLAGIGILYFSARNSFGPSEAARHNAERVYICSETGKTFTYTVKGGKTFPVHSPYSGKDTGYPAQFCYWTADGKLKKEPTYVLMNVYKHVKGPTFCPDCGRFVPADNPVVTDGSTPPPTKAEYEKRKASRGRNATEDDDEQ